MTAFRRDAKTALDSLAAHTFPGGQVWQDRSERS